jgi:hypothetical protein
MTKRKDIVVDMPECSIKRRRKEPIPPCTDESPLSVSPSLIGTLDKLPTEILVDIFATVILDPSNAKVLSLLLANRATYTIARDVLTNKVARGLDFDPTLAGKTPRYRPGVDYPVVTTGAAEDLLSRNLSSSHVIHKVLSQRNVILKLDADSAHSVSRITNICRELAAISNTSNILHLDLDVGTVRPDFTSPSSAWAFRSGANFSQILQLMSPVTRRTIGRYTVRVWYTISTVDYYSSEPLRASITEFENQLFDNGIEVRRLSSITHDVACWEVDQKYPANRKRLVWWHGEWVEDGTTTNQAPS